MGEHHDREDMSAGQGWRNFRRSELPLAEKLRRTARNNFKKFWSRKPCCGHPGDPGC